MLSDELELLAGDVLNVFGVSLKTGGVVGKLRRLAGYARKLEASVSQPPVDVDAVARDSDGTIVSFEHAQKQRLLADMAERGSK